MTGAVSKNNGKVLFGEFLDLGPFCTAVPRAGSQSHNNTPASSATTVNGVAGAVRYFAGVPGAGGATWIGGGLASSLSCFSSSNGDQTSSDSPRVNNVQGNSDFKNTNTINKRHEGIMKSDCDVTAAAAAAVDDDDGPVIEEVEGEGGGKWKQRLASTSSPPSSPSSPSDFSHHNNTSTATQPAAGLVRYRLQSVVIHYGSHDSGHFVTYKRVSPNYLDPRRTNLGENILACIDDSLLYEFGYEGVALHQQRVKPQDDAQGNLRQRHRPPSDYQDGIDQQSIRSVLNGDESRWFMISDERVELVVNPQADVFGHGSQYVYMLFYEKMT